MQAKDRLIVALDVDGLDRAIEMIDVLSPEVEIFKVGIGPFTAFGQAVLEKLETSGKKVFLDLKFHDIPNTVKNAAYAAAAKNVFMMNFHCLGGVQMMKAAAEGANEAVNEGKAKTKPILLGVTILTSMDENDMAAIGLSGDVKTKVLELAALADKAGLDGVVASPREAEAIRETMGKDFVIVTPGVRPAWATTGDQKRVLTPKQAIDGGADYIVVGRPIIQADDPAEAARRIIQEM